MLRDMTCTLIHNGKRCLALISCHANGKFSYFQDDRWVTASTVPYAVLYAPEMPEEERRRVLAKMDWLGVKPG